MKDDQIMKVDKPPIKTACIIVEKVESKELSDISAKITIPFNSFTSGPTSNMHLEVANLVPKSSDEPLKNVKEGEKALLSSSRAPQVDLIITQEEDVVQIEDLDVIQAVATKEKNQPAAGPELIMPLEFMILQSEVSGVVPTKSPSEFASVIIYEVAKSESKDNLVLGKEVKEKTFLKRSNEAKQMGRRKPIPIRGGIKRHHFKRGPMTHGSKSHRAIGSIGAGTTPGRVYKGKKMPGRMGGTKRKIRKLRIVKIDNDLRIVMIKGAVPGKPGNLLRIAPAKIVGKNIPKS
ncbi:hypothetical protein TEA_000899 [Camellia sinensis var. sinensis]|uniref:Large ribosomal subunit protein uL3c n=1 Tax=Camellia sinensis var. sinensis TaxID=542762 RepID=A0A4S4ERD9_CAMSN|nr:hypothetical protein TEA_000899 [Camellia sinensis var. sinensis]